MARTPRPGRPVRGSQTGRPIMALMDLLGRRWTLRVIWELRDGRLASAEQTLSFEQFKDITGLAHWGEIEQRFDAAP